MRIVKDHPLARGLIFAPEFGANINRVNDTKPVYTLGDCTFCATPDGVGLQCESDINNGFYFHDPVGLSANDLNTSDGYTISFTVYQENNSSAGVFNVGNASGTEAISLWKSWSSDWKFRTSSWNSSNSADAPGVLNQWMNITASYDPGTDALAIYVNDDKGTGTESSPTTNTSTDYYVAEAFPQYDYAIDGRIGRMLMWDRVLTDVDVWLLHQPNNGLFERFSSFKIFLAATAGAPGPITGSGSPSEAADTSAGAGTVLITGSGAPAEVADTAAGAGNVLISGSGAPAEAADTSVGAGITANRGSGTPAEALDTSAGAGNVLVTGSGTPAEDADTSSGSGFLTAEILGSGAPAEAVDTSAGAGIVTWLGSGSPSELQDTSSGSGTVATLGAGSPLEAADTSSGAGSVATLGAGAPAEAADTSSGSGLVLITGSGAPTEMDDTGLGFDDSFGADGLDSETRHADTPTWKTEPDQDWTDWDEHSRQ